MIKNLKNNITRARALNSIVSAFFITVIVYCFLDAVSLSAPTSNVLLANIIPFAHDTFIGSISALAVSVCAYYIWLEYGLTAISSMLKDNKWFQKPLLVLG